MFYSGSLLRTNAQETACHIALSECSKEIWEEQGYAEVFAGGKNKHNQISKQSLLIPKEQISQVNDLNAFLQMGRCKSLGSWKLFL